MKKKVYLDCGTHYGEGLREFIQNHNINDDWIVKTFEPNPDCKVKEKLIDIKLKDFEIIEKAVWIFDGTIQFSIENIETWGEDHGSVITELNSSHLKRAKPPIIVECIDFHKILSQYPKSEYDVLVKMDIEGAEYQVLRHVISMGSAVNINQIFVEWHYVDFDYENESTTNNLVNTLKMIGIDVKNWK